MPFDSYARMRPETTRLMEMMDNGEIDARAVADMALSWLSESDVKEMMQANDLVEDESDEEEDGQPDEAQEWADFDADC
jgi:hypothetical protein